MKIQKKIGKVALLMIALCSGWYGTVARSAQDSAVEQQNVAQPGSVVNPVAKLSKEEIALQEQEFKAKLGVAIAARKTATEAFEKNLTLSEQKRLQDIATNAEKNAKTFWERHLSLSMTYDKAALYLPYLIKMGASGIFTVLPLLGGMHWAAGIKGLSVIPGNALLNTALAGTRGTLIWAQPVLGFFNAALDVGGAYKNVSEAKKKEQDLLPALPPSSENRVVPELPVSLVSLEITENRLVAAFKKLIFAQLAHDKTYGILYGDTQRILQIAKQEHALAEAEYIKMRTDLANVVPASIKDLIGLSSLVAVQTAFVDIYFDEARARYNQLYKPSWNVNMSGEFLVIAKESAVQAYKKGVQLNDMYQALKATLKKESSENTFINVTVRIESIIEMVKQLPAKIREYDEFRKKEGLRVKLI